MSDQNQIIEDGEHYQLEVGEAVWGEWTGKRVFLLRNKEFDLIEAEGPNEMQARAYFKFYEEAKADYLINGLPTEGTTGPSVH